MPLFSHWICSPILPPLAALALAGTAFNAPALTDTNAELKEAAANRAVPSALAQQGQRLARGGYVPTTAKRLDSFKPVLPPERALGLAMAPAHAQAQAKAAAQPRDAVVAKADTAPAAAKR